MIPERRSYYFTLSDYHPELRKIEVKADGDLKIKVRFDDGTTENREYNLEYLRQYADQIFDREDWVLGENNVRGFGYSRNQMNVNLFQKRGLPRPRSIRKTVIANEFIFLADGETSTSEVSDRFFDAPAPETPAEFQLRLQKRITLTARTSFHTHLRCCPTS